MSEAGFVERLRSAASIVDAAFADLREEFHTASSSDRAKMLDVLSEFELKHQSHLAQFARAVDTAPSVLSTAAKDLHYRSTAELVQCEFGVPKGLADQTVRVGTLLEKTEYPNLCAAVEAGTVSSHQAGVVIRQLDDWRGEVADEFLVRAEAAATEWAVGTDMNEALKPEQLQKLLRTWRKKEHPETVEQTAEELFEKRRASACVQRDGMIRATVLLTPKQGAAMLAFLDAYATPRTRTSDPDGDFRTRDQKIADAFASAFMIASKAKEAPTQAGSAPTLFVTTTVEEMRKYAEGLPGIATVSRTGKRPTGRFRGLEKHLPERDQNCRHQTRAHTFFAQVVSGQPQIPPW